MFILFCPLYFFSICVSLLLSTWINVYFHLVKTELSFVVIDISTDYWNSVKILLQFLSTYFHHFQIQEFFNTIIFLVSRTRGLSWRLSRQSLVARSRPSIPAPDHVMLCRRLWVVLHMTVEVPRLKRPHSSSDWGMYKCTRRFYWKVFILALWKY